jgi:hypothetical protein
MSASAYQHRFGSVRKAYELIGYEMSPAQQRAADAPRTFNTGKCAWNDLQISDDEVIRRLEALREDAGELTVKLIEMTPGLPKQGALIKRFGSIRRVYELAGHSPKARQLQCFERAERARISVIA